MPSRPLCVVAVLGMLAFAGPARAMDEMGRLMSMDLAQLSEVRMVTAAGRFPQKLTEAPSRVTIVTAEEMRAFGHRNLADVVRSIRGLYTGHDGSYELAGTRGISPAGDFNTRMLVMIDGVRLSDPVYSQGPIGNEFPIDVAMIDRVEFLPGPGSAAYGNNAFLGLLNVITRAPTGSGQQTATVGAGSRGDRSAFYSADLALGDGLQALLSASRTYTAGGDVSLPALAVDGSDGVSRGMDSEAYNRFFARIEAGPWNVRLAVGDRTKRDPTVPYGTIQNDPRMHQDDTFMHASARRALNLSPDTEAAVQAFYNRYEFRGDYPTDYPPPTVNHDFELGERYGLEGQLRTRRFDGHVLSLWGEWIVDPTIRMINRDLAPAATYLDDRREEQAWGLFAQDEVRLNRAWLLNLGLRHDRLATGQNSTNPRLALIREAPGGLTAKLLYGSAFRSPDAYERFYAIEDYSVANPELSAERVRTLEATLEQAGSHHHLAASLFRSRITGLIELTSLDSGLVRFENRASARIEGLELEAEYRSPDGLKLRTSYSHQRAIDADSGDWLPNSPRNLVKLNAILPLAEDQRLGLEMRLESGRRTVADTRTGGFHLVNLTWTGEQAHGPFDWSVSLRNVFDRRYDLPATLDHDTDRLPQVGRSLRVSASLRF